MAWCDKPEFEARSSITNNKLFLNYRVISWKIIYLCLRFKLENIQKSCNKWFNAWNCQRWESEIIADFSIRDNETYCAFWFSRIWNSRNRRPTRWEITRNRDPGTHFPDDVRSWISGKIAFVTWKVKTQVDRGPVIMMILVLFVKDFVHSTNVHTIWTL